MGQAETVVWLEGIVTMSSARLGSSQRIPISQTHEAVGGACFAR